MVTRNLELRGDGVFSYNIYPNASKNEFINACKRIEKRFPNAKKDKILIDVDGTSIQVYHLNEKEINVFNDYYVGAVYVDSEVELEDLF